jgi:outer membrane receptor for ferrienterochelin and colicins
MLDMSVSKQLLMQKLALTCGAKNLFDVTNVSQAGRAPAIGIHKGNFGSSAPMGFGRTYFIQLSFSLNHN